MIKTGFLLNDCSTARLVLQHTNEQDREAQVRLFTPKSKNDITVKTTRNYKAGCNTADFIKKVLSVYTHSMATIYLSLSAQVAKSTFFMKPPILKYLKLQTKHLKENIYNFYRYSKMNILDERRLNDMLATMAWQAEKVEKTALNITMAGRPKNIYYVDNQDYSSSL